MTTKRSDITSLLLKKLYVKKKLSTPKIASILGCHRATINHKLHEYFIPIRKPFKKVDLDKETLSKLYLSDKLSTYKIAKQINCSVRTITNKMRRYHIKGRPIKKRFISKTTLVDLYTNKKLSLKKIGKLYQMTPSGILKRMRKYDIYRRTSWDTNTGIKNPFQGTLEEKSYLIGFRLGDLGVRLSSKRTGAILIGCSTTKKEQVILIKNLFENYAKVWVGKIRKNGVVSTSSILHPSFSFLLPKNDRIESWIVSTPKNMNAFIAGYTDAEGSLGVYNKRAKYRLGSYDKEILKQIDAWFKKNGIKSIFRLEQEKKKGQNQDFWRITVNEAKSLLTLYKMIFPYLKHKKRVFDFNKVKRNIDLRLQNGTIRI